MSNTLIFAYVGTALFLLLLVYLSGDTTKFFNMDSIVGEFISGLAGSIGLIITIPLTAFLSAYFENFKFSDLKAKEFKKNDGR